MYGSVQDLKSFYNGKIGRVVSRILQARIQEFWRDTRNMRVAGFGYATPYLRRFVEGAERVVACMQAEQGAHAWPSDQKNLVCLFNSHEIPLENSALDRAVLVHALEFSEAPQELLKEIWRIMKPGGKVLIVVPNRSGFWARADWSPFGQGTPYSKSQIMALLSENNFVHEQTRAALFLLPMKLSALFRSAPILERVGSVCFPFAAGVHMIEVSKQLYARSDGGKAQRVRARSRSLIAKPFPVPQNFSQN